MKKSSGHRTPEDGAGTNRKAIDERFRDYLIRTNIDVIVLGLLLACIHARGVYAEEETADTTTSNQEGGTMDEHGGEGNEHEEKFEAEEAAAYALLFPWFAELLGVIAYFLVSRYAHAIPFTAIMFCVGAIIGVTSRSVDTAIEFSASTWGHIEGELILLIFLPGLLFLDSYNLDVHLLMQTFTQILHFAFPMMLAGTVIIALVGKYILPYGWSFDLCMTFGSILGATDPVAVAVLMNELGAPARLKMHVCGESIMNDGSAAVFYQIFAARFFAEMGIEGFGSEIGWGEGFARFFRLSLGGACIGVAFGLGLLIILYTLNRRLSNEDAIVQVVATITTSYLAFFTSEILCKCSGIIAVFGLAVTVKAFGETLYNDTHLFHHFWEITEFILNTLLFTLAGLVWTFELAKFSDWKDWGYLIAFYFLLNIIRFFLIFASYPLIARIGIGTNWREAVFMSYGGLRGGVGIALALSLYAEIDGLVGEMQANGEVAPLAYLNMVQRVFFLMGGIALLTLVVNGLTAGPLLIRLGLVTPSECRKKVVENYYQHLIQYTLKEYVALLTEDRFRDVDFTVVKTYIPFFEDITYENLMYAVKAHKKSSPSDGYKPPYLKNLIPYLYKPGDSAFGIGVVNSEEEGVDDGIPIVEEESPMDSEHDSERSKMNRQKSVLRLRQTTGNIAQVFNIQPAELDKNAVLEERVIFISVLRAGYYRLVEYGEIKARGFVGRSLFTSLNYAEDAVTYGLPLADWNTLEVVSNGQSFLRKALNFVLRLSHKIRHNDFDLDFYTVGLKVRQILAFIGAHDWAKRHFTREFSKDGFQNISDHLTDVEKTILKESDEQVRLAKEALTQLGATDVKIVTSHYLCQILLNRAAHHLEQLKEHGLMSDKEAGDYLQEIEVQMSRLFKYHKKVEKMNAKDKANILAQAPAELLEKWNIEKAKNGNILTERSVRNMNL